MVSLTCKKQRYLNKRLLSIRIVVIVKNFNGPFCEKNKVQKKKKGSRSNNFGTDEYPYSILNSDPRISEYSDTRSSPNYQDDFALNFFVPLLIESGFPVSRDFIFKIKPLPLPLRDYILKHLSTPRSLKLCCRDTLRKAYKGRQINSFVTMTEMPKSLKDYILLKPLLKCIP